VSPGTRTPTIDDSEPWTRKTGRAGINVVTLDGDQLHLHPKPSPTFASTMAFKLHGISSFSCTRRVALIAKERNVPYQLLPVNLEQAEHKTPAYLAHQPFGQLPYIAVRPSLFLLVPSSTIVVACSLTPFEQQDDGFELYESRAIGRYVATLGSGPELIPADPKAHAKFEQAASIEYAQFDPVATGVIAEKVYKPYRGLAPDEERVKELVPQLEGKLDGYEAILSKQKYLAGNVRLVSFGHACREVVDLMELLCTGGHPRGSIPFASLHHCL